MRMRTASSRKMFIINAEIPMLIIVYCTKSSLHPHTHFCLPHHGVPIFIPVYYNITVSQYSSLFNTTSLCTNIHHCLYHNTNVSPICTPFWYHNITVYHAILSPVYNNNTTVPIFIPVYNKTKVYPIFNSFMPPNHRVAIFIPGYHITTLSQYSSLYP